MSLSRTIAAHIMEKNTDVSHLVSVLKKYSLTALLPQIYEALVQMERAASKKELLRIETPFPLHEETLAKIKTIAGNSDAPHEVVINKEVLAGFKAQYRGILYDASAKRIIKQLTNH